MKKLVKIIAFLLLSLSISASAEMVRKQIVLIAGKKSHGPEGNGIHDYGWNVRLIKTMLENSNVKDQVDVSIFFNGWPENAPVLSKADTIMIISDGRDGDKFENSLHLQSPEIINFVEQQTKRGCGLVTFHFSTFAPDANADLILEWNGGYFDWQTDGKRKWYSAIKTLDTSVIPAAKGHPVLRGVKPFKMKEEFYYNIRFKEEDSRLKSILEVPELKSQQELGNTVAWAVERTDGGRGFATTCGHFYNNWEHEDFRKTILNGLVWSAKIEVPENGVVAKYFSRPEITVHLSKNDKLEIEAVPENFRRDKLAAWCIVPFDAKKRSPEQRAQMVVDLGLKRVAYDWRKQHVKEFEDEILAYKKHGIEYFAFWGFHPEMSKLIKKYKITPQLWVMLHDPGKQKDNQTRIEMSAKALETRVKEAKELGCKVGLYNHGGWAGEPSTMVGVTKWFREKGYDNVGIIYNFHHGHGHIQDFKSLFTLMKPYLFCLNINGMNDGARPKILTISEGKHEKNMIKYVIDSGYSGPVGILDHLNKEDSYKVLKRNIEGLEKLLKNSESEVKKSSLKSEGAFIHKDNKIWRAPLKNESFPHWQRHINRDRVYDYYAKQALFFGRTSEKHIPAFPGLDSAKGTHWGNQNDAQTWHDGRANEMKFGSMVSGVIRGKGVKVTKAFSVHLKDDVYVIFDAEKNQFVKAWKGKQVSWSPVRFGLIKGLTYNPGQELAIDNKVKEDSKVFKGLYRSGQRVIFAVGKSFLEAVYENDKVLIKSVEKPVEASPQWPERIETKGQLGGGQPYVIDTLTLPYKNPWNSLFFIGGVDAISKTRIAVCTMHGDVWICDIQKDDFSKLSWKRFAAGLHQPLGLKVHNGVIHVTCRDQIVALHDTNEDDEADFYECVSNRFSTSAGGHDYVTGLRMDNQGRFYIASGNQGVCQIDEKNNSLKVLGSGLRNPNGLGVNEDGSVVLTSVQEGSWTPASAICDMSQGDHFGLGGPKNGQYVEPMLYMPRGIDNSSGGQVHIGSEQWGPVKGQWVHFSMGFASHFLLLREVINGKSQSAAVVLPGEFLSGAHRGSFSKFDGQLYVGGSQGWGNYGVLDGVVQRVRYVGGHYPYPSSYETRENGVLLTFKDAQPKEITNVKNWFAQHWNYRYSAAYGSKEFSVEKPAEEGHDRLIVKSVQYLEGGKKIFIEIPQIQPVDQLHLHFNGNVPLEIFATVHQLGEAFTEYPSYKKVTKVYGKALSEEALSDPKQLIQACIACHHPTQRVVGPAFTEIRKMYKDNPAGIVMWAQNPQVKNPQLPPMPSFSFMGEETLLKIANYILKE
ncbi:MAG: ThuA domain-containing protein [Lentisphaeraceae bacterium]|nr:ThuA domain-containing protein [Lentisphaeraceae bacterium]